MAFKLSFAIPSSRWACICNLNDEKEFGIYLYSRCIAVYAHYADTAYGRTVLGFNACLVLDNAREAFAMEQSLKQDGFDVYIHAIKS